MDREQVIKTGISKNYKISKINKELQEIGEGEYNPLTYLPNYLNLPKQAWSNLVEGSKGLITAGSEFVKPIHEISKAGFKAQPGKKLDAVKEAFKKTILDNEQARRFVKGASIGAGTGLALGSLLSPVGIGVGTVGGALTGGMVGLLGPKDFADTMLSTYHINLDDIKNKNIDYRDIAQGIFQNPLYAATDIGGPTGALKKIGKVGKAVAKDTGSLQQIIPGKHLADFNRELTNLKQWSRTQNADIYGGYNQLAKTPLANRKEIVKNIVSNTGDLTERDLALAEALKNDLRTSEREAIRLGLLDSTEARHNTVAQYVVDNLRDKSNILHHDVMKILNGQELDPQALNIIKEGNLLGDINRLINEGNKLYREGNIAFLSQKLAGVQDPLGIEIARHINLENPNRTLLNRIVS